MDKGILKRSRYTIAAFLFTTPLLYMFIDPVHALTGADPFAILRFAQPILYGFLAFSFYCAAKRLTGWDGRRSLVAAAVFSFQLLALLLGIAYRLRVLRLYQRR